METAGEAKMALEIRSGIAENLHDGFRHAFKYSKLPGNPAPFAADRKPHFLLAAGSALCPFPLRGLARHAKLNS